MHSFVAAARRVWASPYTLLGVAVGLAGLPFGGRMAWRSGVLECHGGLARWLLESLHRVSLPDAIALTLGHTVLGRTEAALDVTRDHERIHVRQFERWGLLMGPAYVGWWVWLALRGRDGYRENPFEREAYGD